MSTSHRDVRDHVGQQEYLAADLAAHLRFLIGTAAVDAGQPDPSEHITGAVVLEALMIGWLDLSHGSAARANYFEHKGKTFPFGTDAENRAEVGL